MSDLQVKYGSQAQAITITLANLADGALRQSASIDNSTLKFFDTRIGGKITTGTSPTTGSVITLYAAASVDGGTIFSGGASGSDALFTEQEDQLFLLGQIIVASTSDKAYEFGPFSLLEAMKGFAIPDTWAIVVKNDTGAALNSTGGNHDVDYQGAQAEAV